MILSHLGLHDILRGEEISWAQREVDICADESLQSLPSPSYSPLSTQHDITTPSPEGPLQTSTQRNAKVVSQVVEKATVPSSTGSSVSKLNRRVNMNYSDESALSDIFNENVDDTGMDSIFASPVNISKLKRIQKNKGEKEIPSKLFGNVDGSMAKEHPNMDPRGDSQGSSISPATSCSQGNASCTTSEHIDMPSASSTPKVLRGTSTVEKDNKESAVTKSAINDKCISPSQEGMFSILDGEALRHSQESSNSPTFTQKAKIKLSKFTFVKKVPHQISEITNNVNPDQAPSVTVARGYKRKQDNSSNDSANQLENKRKNVKTRPPQGSVLNESEESRSNNIKAKKRHISLKTVSKLSTFAFTDSSFSDTSLDFDFETNRDENTPTLKHASLVKNSKNTTKDLVRPLTSTNTHSKTVVPEQANRQEKLPRPVLATCSRPIKPQSSTLATKHAENRTFTFMKSSDRTEPTNAHVSLPANHNGVHVPQKASPLIASSLFSSETELNDSDLEL